MPPLPDIMVKYHQNGSSFTSKSYLAYVSDGPNCLGPGRKGGLMARRIMLLVAAIVMLAAITTSAGAMALDSKEHYAHHPLRVRPGASTSPTGLSPATIKSVYSFPTSLTAGAGKTIAIVDAFDDPTAESDLGVFSSQYGLPACTTANGCFTKVNETGGSGSGGGCSLYETATAAQAGFSQYGQVNCAGKRATPDVSLDADPASGVSVFDSTRFQGQKGWFTVGGTSASSPMWAARSAVAGVVVNASYVYGNNTTFRDITAGDNGAPYLVGYDLVTGRS